MGLRAAGAVSRTTSAAGSAQPALAVLLAHATWNSELGLAFDTRGFDRTAFIALCDFQGAERERLDRLEQLRGLERWWSWPSESVDSSRPSWWIFPTVFVVRRASSPPMYTR